MDYLYYACEWVVVPVSSRKLSILLHTAATLQCVLYHQGSHKRDDGIFVVDFVMRVSSLGALNDFVKEAGGLIGLTHWHEVEMSEFEGAPFLGDHIEGFVDASKIYGEANARLQRGE